VMVVGCLVGCVAHAPQIKPIKLSEVRAPLASMVTVEMRIPRSKYVSILEQGGDNNLARLVPVFRSGTDWENFPEYRLLDVKRGSVYELLGLRANDIIIAADDYVIPSPRKFWQYLLLLRGIKEASIEIRRADRPMLLKYVFTDT